MESPLTTTRLLAALRTSSMPRFDFRSRTPHHALNILFGIFKFATSADDVASRGEDHISWRVMGDEEAFVPTANTCLQS